MEFQNTNKLKRTNGQQDKKVKNAELPNDLIIEILSRLPVKNLLKFSWVCRTWADLISDPLFVNLHREQSMKNVDYIVLSEYDNVVSISRLSMQGNEESDLCRILVESDPDEASLVYVCPLSCDLICFTTTEEKIYLCNPSKREYQILPKTSASSLCYSKIGLVYSSSSREYKVVHLFLRRYSDNSITQGMECETFTFGDHCKISSSSWKTSQEKCPRRVYSNTVSTNGTIYWLIRHYTPGYKLTTDDLIVSFDCKIENFRTISRPPAWPLKNYRNSIELMAVEGNLCIVDVKSMAKKSILDLWMLKENSIWEQMYSVDLHDIGTLRKGKVWLPKYMGDREILFVHTAEDAGANEYYSAKLYNMENRICRSLTPVAEAGVYWESLFDLD